MEGFNLDSGRDQFGIPGIDVIKIGYLDGEMLAISFGGDDALFFTVHVSRSRFEV